MPCFKLEVECGFWVEFGVMKKVLQWRYKKKLEWEREEVGF